MQLPREAEVASARRWTLAVGVAYLVAQLVAFSLDRPPGWDEAIYLSQVDSGAESLPFVASRARGITFLAIPILQLGGSMEQLRAFLAVASAAALVGAFRMWAPVLGFGAVAAAALFAPSWPALFYGSELMPNLWVALVAVAATAVLARRLARGDERTDELVAGALVAVAALIRPLDAVVLTAALVLVPLVVRRATWSWTGFLLFGLAVGWAPWLVEMTSRFGSVTAAFDAAARLGHTGRWSLSENARQYLALSDGPPIGPVAGPEVPAFGVLWIAGLAVLSALGIRAAAHRGLAPALAVPTTAGLAFAAEYVVFTDAQAPRFLLPALALLTVPSGLGLASVVSALGGRRDRARRAAIAVATAAVLLLWAGWQLAIAAEIEADAGRQRAAAERVGLRVGELEIGQRCHVFADASFPIVAYAAGCRGSEVRSLPADWGDAARRLERDGIAAFLVLRAGEEPPTPAGVVLIELVPGRSSTWFVYSPP
jgi:hypothetical protein